MRGQRIHRFVMVLAATSCMAPLTNAADQSRFASSACIAKPENGACERLAREVSADINAVRALGDELEHRERYEDAATAYRVALTMHPNHRDLLQRLINARGQARSKSLVAGEPLKAPEMSAALPPPSPAAALPGAKSATANSPSSSPAKARSRDKALGEPSGRFLALVIGNEQYSDFTKLKTPLADAQALANVLTKDYGFDVQVLANATRYQIVSALSRLRQEATENDNVLIYYAGHGYLDQATSRGYWLPVDAEHDNLGNWLSTADITDVLAGLQARHALILADSCFSGTLLRGDLTVSIDERQSLLRKLSSQRSRSIMTSGGLEPVIDDGAGKHSIFAGAVIKALRDNRQHLEAGRLFMQIREHVAARAAQTPQYAPLRNAGHDGGDFIFVHRSKK